MDLQANFSSLISNLENISQISDTSDNKTIFELSLNALKQKDSMTIKFLIILAIIYKESELYEKICKEYDLIK